MRLAMPCDRPNAWPNGLVREMLPDPLREWLDRQDEGNGAVRCGPSDAWTGNPAGPTRSGRCPRPSNRPVGPAATGVALLAARLAEGVDRVEYDDGRPGLGEYDIAFATKDEEGAE